jgi:hypothetical protein
MLILLNTVAISKGSVGSVLRLFAGLIPSPVTLITVQHNFTNTITG